MKKIKKMLFILLSLAVVLPLFISKSTWESNAASGSWKHDNKGWWYALSSGSYVKSDWLKIDGGWYYFNSRGYMATGWQKIGGKWYYFGSNGKMKTGWQKVGKNWFYFSASGVMQTGWKVFGLKSYYFKSDGSMATGKTNIGDRFYVFDKNGKVVFMVDEKGLFTMDETLFGMTFDRLKDTLCIPELTKPEDWPYWGRFLTVTFIKGNLALLFQDGIFVMAYYDFEEAGRSGTEVYNSACVLWDGPCDTEKFYSGKNHYIWNCGRFTYEQYNENYTLTGDYHYRQRYISELYKD